MMPGQDDGFRHRGVWIGRCSAGDYMDQEWKGGPVGRQMTKLTNGRNAYFADLCQRAARCHPKSPCNRCVRNFVGT